MTIYAILLSFAAALSISSEQIKDLRLDSKLKVVAFLSADCPCSTDHESLLKSSQLENKEIQHVVIAARSEHFIDFPIPVVTDLKSRLANVFRVARTPHVFLLDQTNHVLFQGGITDSRRVSTAKKNYLKQAIEEALNGQLITKPEAKVLGCVLER